MSWFSSLIRRPYIQGLLGALTLVVIALAVLFVLVGWARAADGEWAAACLRTPACLSQAVRQAQAPPSPSAVSPTGPDHH